MHVRDRKTALAFVPALRGVGDVLGDGDDDDDRLYAACARRGLRFIAPRRRPFTGRATSKAFHPDRLCAIGTLEASRVAAGWTADTFGRGLMRERRKIETTLGRWCTHALGFKGLPAWKRGVRRVTRWVHAKRLIVAAATLAQRRADE